MKKNPKKSVHAVVSGVLTIAVIGMFLSPSEPQSLSAQSSGQDIDIFNETEGMNGVTIKRDRHTIITCPAETSSIVADMNLELTSARFWVYAYSRKEPETLGGFYLSPGELALSPHLESIDTLKEIAGGKRHYFMSAVELSFTCGKGLSKPAICGDGILDFEEECDDENGTPNDGCTECLKDFCEDSDATQEFSGGLKNIGTKGTVTGTGGGGIYTSTDNCMNEETLLEHGCIGTSVNVTNVSCANGCSDGVCNAAAECGNGILEAGEECDRADGGCDQETCTVNEGYVCDESNRCEMYLPTLQSGEGGDTQSSVSSSTANSESDTDQCASSAGCQSTGKTEDLGALLTISDVNPDSDYTPPPEAGSMGMPIGQFRVANGAENPKTATMVGFFFTVESTNVVIDARAIKIFNKTDSTVKNSCKAFYVSGDPYAAPLVSGTFLARCDLPGDGAVLSTIDAGGNQTFVLEVRVENPRLNENARSRLQASLQKFTQPAQSFSPTTSHIQWLDGSADAVRYHVEQNPDIVESTLYGD